MIRPEVLDAMLAAGCTAEQIVAAVKADAAVEAERGPRWITGSLRQEVFNRDGYRCTYCGTQVEDPHCDHVIPYSRGGSTTIDNLTTACRSCNLSKKDRTPEEWEAARCR